MHSNVWHVGPDLVADDKEAQRSSDVWEQQH